MGNNTADLGGGLCKHKLLHNIPSYSQQVSRRAADPGARMRRHGGGTKGRSIPPLPCHDNCKDFAPPSPFLSAHAIAGRIPTPIFLTHALRQGSRAAGRVLHTPTPTMRYRSTANA